MGSEPLVLTDLPGSGGRTWGNPGVSAKWESRPEESGRAWHGHTDRLHRRSQPRDPERESCHARAMTRHSRLSAPVCGLCAHSLLANGRARVPPFRPARRDVLAASRISPTRPRRSGQTATPAGSSRSLNTSTLLLREGIFEKPTSVPCRKWIIFQTDKV